MPGLRIHMELTCVRIRPLKKEPNPTAMNNPFLISKLRNWIRPNEMNFFFNKKNQFSPDINPLLHCFLTRSGSVRIWIILDFRIWIRFNEWLRIWIRPYQKPVKNHKKFRINIKRIRNTALL